MRKLGIFQKELQHMMYGFGDDANPLPETVALVEDIVVEYVSDFEEPKEPIATKNIPPKVLTEDSPLLPVDSDNIVKKQRAKSFAKSREKNDGGEDFPGVVKFPQKDEVNVDFDDSICLKEPLNGKNTRKVANWFGFAT